MAPRNDNVPNTLLVCSLILTVTGTILLCYFTSLDEFETLQGLKEHPRSKRAEQYMACFFVFAWLASAAATSLQWNSTLSVQIGLVGAIILYGYPFEDLDNVRQLLERDTASSYRYLAAGGVLGYLGVGCGLLAPAVKRALHSDISKPILYVTALVNVLTIVSVVLLLTSNAVEVPALIKRNTLAGQEQLVLREVLFNMSQIQLFLTMIFDFGVFTGVPDYLWLATAIGALEGLPVLADLFNAQHGLNDLHSTDTVRQVEAGAGLMWLTTVLIVLACNFRRQDRTPSYNSYDSLSTA
eukprot:m.268189 g.268189  ORF g.268189 m.268189 type:complete len:297 (-) comp17647_c2_seq2:7265-8155(-)